MIIYVHLVGRFADYAVVRRGQEIQIGSLKECLATAKAAAWDRWQEIYTMGLKPVVVLKPETGLIPFYCDIVAPRWHDEQ